MRTAGLFEAEVADTVVIAISLLAELVLQFVAYQNLTNAEDIFYVPVESINDENKPLLKKGEKNLESDLRVALTNKAKLRMRQFQDDEHHISYSPDWKNISIQELFFLAYAEEYVWSEALTGPTVTMRIKF